VLKTSRKSLRILGTVGEPINPEAWEWYFKVVGNEGLSYYRYLGGKQKQALF
jgi:acyl-coenzyme A synthetase/AMP-(fatty) acid ligase